MRASVHRGILANATPDRDDRLFPGDVHQFLHNGLGFAYGAAGVLYALARTGAGRFPDHEQWLVHAVHKGLCNESVGFYMGDNEVRFGSHESLLGASALCRDLVGRGTTPPCKHLPDQSAIIPKKTGFESRRSLALPH